MRARSLPPLVALLATLARPARAVPASPRPVLPVQVAADRDEASALDGVLRDVMSGLSIDLDVTIVTHIDPGTLIRGHVADRNHPPLGRAFLDLADPARITVYVVDGTWQRVLVRHVPRTSNPDVDRETVGRIVSTAVEALVAGSFVDSSEPVAVLAATGPSEPAPPPRARPKLAGRMGVMYEVGLLSQRQAIVHGPALYGAASFGRGAVRPSLWLTGQRRWPVVADDPPVGFRLDTTAVRLLGGIDLDVGPSVTLEIGFGAGLDIVHLEPRGTTPDDRTWLAPERSFTVGLARAMLGARWRAGGSISLHALFVTDFDASRTRFLFERAEGSESVLAPYGVRPGVALTVSVP
jgi:hypothetical protein